MTARTLPIALPLVAAGVLLLAGCQLSSRVVAVESRHGANDSLFTLRVGQEVHPDAVLGIVLLGVSNDSRCPMDVVCIWAGDATVEIGVAFGDGPTLPYLLHTGIEPRSVVVGGSYRITITGLQPAPRSCCVIPQDQYVATLRLQRVTPLPD